MCGKENGLKEGKGPRSGSFSNGLKILISFITLLICIFFSNQYDGEEFLQVIGLFTFFLGGAIVVIGAETLGKNFTLSHQPKGLVTNGIYSKIRHPMDYGGILLSIGFAFYSLSIYGLILAIAVVTPLHIYSVVVEERIMIGKYGGEYDNYKERTFF